MFVLFVTITILCLINCTSKKVVVNEESRPQTIDVLVNHGLNGIKVNYDMRTLESLETDNVYSYLDALDMAIESFLTDKSNRGSPLSIVPNTMESYRGNASKPQQNLEKLIELINTGGSLCMPDIEGASDDCAHAEEGENIEQNWIFLLQIPELSDYLFWAIVAKDGKEDVYNYGFK